MPAELSLNRIGNGPNLQREGGFFERGHHHAGAKPPQRTAIGAGRAGGVCLGQFREICATTGLSHQFIRLLFGFHQNVGGVVFLGRLNVAVGRVIGGAQGLFGGCAVDHTFEGDVGHQGALLVFNRNRHGFRFVTGGFGQHGLLDQLVQNARKQGFSGQLLILRGQGVPGGQHVAQGDLHTIHRGNHGIDARGLLSLSRHHQSERKRGG